MKEFLWFFILVAGLVGLWFARSARKAAPGPEIPPDASRFDRLCAWLEKFVRMEFRWWLLVGVLLGVALAYIFDHGIMRVALNLLLFFDWHPVLVSVLLALSLAGLIFSWKAQLTVGSVVGAALVVAPLSLLVFFGLHCLFVVLFVIGLLGVLWAWQDRLKWWAWIGSFLIVFLAASLFMSNVFYGVPDTRPETSEYVKLSLVLAVGLLGLLRAWRTQAWLLGWTSAFLVLVLLAGLGLSWTNEDLPGFLDEIGDYMLIGLGIVLVIVAAKVVLSARLQPLGWASAVMAVFLGGGLFLASNLYGHPEDFADIEDQFKYGSIGADHFMARGVPFYVWQVLPKKYPPEDIFGVSGPNLMGILPKEGVLEEDYRPRYGKAAGEQGLSYEAFGMVREKNRRIRVLGQDTDTLIERPIGFSKRKVFGIDFIGMNCAFCHASTIRTDGQIKPHVVSGMPASTFDIELYFLFLFGATGQPDFTSDQLMKDILAKNEHLKLGKQLEDRGIRGLCQEINNSFHRLAYRVALIPLTRIYAQDLKVEFSFIDPNEPDRIPRFGPGRVDAWSPGKRTLIKPPLPVLYPGGIIDHTSIWNQKARNGMRFHWDGNTNDIKERNIIAGLVVNGPQIECLDVKRVLQITDWIMERPAPRFDDFFTPDPDSGYLGDREAGRLVFEQWCASCHAPDGERVGRVEPLDARELRTDPARAKSFTVELQKALNTITRYGKDEAEAWELRNFRSQNGYVNMLLDGIWLRAPYLHNGSVPTLRDLLNKPCKTDTEKGCRPLTFYRGQDFYDDKNVGFKSEPTMEQGDTVEVVLFRGGKEQRITSQLDPKGMVTVDDLRISLHGLTVAEAIDNEKTLVQAAVNQLIEETNIAPDEAQIHIQNQFKDTKITDLRINSKATTYFRFDTGIPGNRNIGHLYGTDLKDEDKEHLVEFLKSL